MSANHKRPGRKPKAQVETVYEYRNETGKLLYQVVRYCPKDFSYRRPTRAGNWSSVLGRVRRVPYLLPDLLAAVAVRPHEPIYIVEGEKDVDRLWSLGLLATCNSGGGGAGKWPPSHSRLLAGKDVIIVPDNDVTGEQHAADIAGSLERHAKSVRIIRLPDLPRKGDVSDWLDVGGSVQELQRLIDESRPLEPHCPVPEFYRDEYEMWRATEARGPILASNRTAQEKLLMLILTSMIKWPAPTVDVLAGYMSLTLRRVKQMIAALRQAGVLSVKRVKRRSLYLVVLDRLKSATGFTLSHRHW